MTKAYTQLLKKQRSTVHNHSEFNNHHSQYNANIYSQSMAHLKDLIFYVPKIKVRALGSTVYCKLIFYILLRKGHLPEKNSTPSPLTPYADKDRSLSKILGTKAINGIQKMSDYTENNTFLTIKLKN